MSLQFSLSVVNDKHRANILSQHNNFQNVFIDIAKSFLDYEKKDITNPIKGLNSQPKT